jgi:hypothetical protein
MKKKPQEEVGALAQWCRTVIQFLADKSGGMHPLSNASSIVNALESTNDRAGLTMIQKDLREDIRDLKPADRAELNGRLAGHGEDLNLAEAKRSAEIARILRQGAASTHDEYRMLMERVDEIFQNERKQAELEAINRVLAASKFQ